MFCFWRSKAIRVCTRVENVDVVVVEGGDPSLEVVRFTALLDDGAPLSAHTHHTQLSRRVAHSDERRPTRSQLCARACRSVAETKPAVRG